MQGRSRFTRQEADQIRQILREKATADRSRQKVLRGQLRSKYRFYITGFRNDTAGFTAMDFDDLVKLGSITIEGGAAGLDLPGIDLSILSESRPYRPPERHAEAAGTDSPDDPEARTWYELLREAYRPATLRFLLLAESPPDPGSADRRYFYSPTLSQHDNLYRGVSEAAYGLEATFDLARKTDVLERLKDDGYWLIDAVESPINKSSSSARRTAIRSAAPALVERCRRLDPAIGIIICHTVVYKEAAHKLHAAGLKVLHDRPLPFPLGNWRADFVRGFRQAIEGR
jgi:hypothetical protein